MSKVIGIDLGTANSCVAIIENGRPVVIADPEGNKTTPSVFAINANQEPLVGYPAVRQTTTNPLNTIFAVKRLIGLKYDSPEVQEAARRLPYKVIAAPNNDAWVETDGVKRSPEEISSHVLIHMKEIAEKYLKERVYRAVITVPAHFNDSQRQATKDAGRIAGLDVLRIINEPTAAALAYGLEGVDLSEEEQARRAGRSGADRTIAVFDLGGGTFDISILELRGGMMDVKATHGDTYLGGEDFDLEILNFLVHVIRSKAGINVMGDKMALQVLKDTAREIKHTLSFQPVTKVSLPFLSKGMGQFQIEIERKTLEKIVEPILRRVEKPCYAALEDAHLRPEDIDEVILVGGMTRMPAVKRYCAKIFGKQPLDSVDPDEAVARGAAIQAGLLEGFVKGVSLLDVTSLSLGMETQGGIMNVLIPRNTKIPMSKTEIFTTSAPNQPKVSIHVLQGESSFAPDNKTLGRFELSGIRPAPRGVPQIAVTFAVDEEGIVHVSAKDLDTGEEKQVEIVASSGLSDEDIAKLLKENTIYNEQRERSQTQNREDSEKAQEAATDSPLQTLKHNLKSAIFTYQFKLDTQGQQFKDPDRQQMLDALRDGRLALEDAETEEQVQLAITDLRSAGRKLDQHLQDLDDQ
ncbi:molecular chaperone DnaK [bacterium]|nr:molecular chaperone DnaK [bacterium]